jgi:hypothetical protein
MAEENETPNSPSLSEGEVERRLGLLDDLKETDRQKVVDELYAFGQSMAKEILDRIRALESKATSFAAYGTGLVAFLVSGNSVFQLPKGYWTQGIEILAGLCALLCTIFSVKVSLLREYAWISQDEWLHRECLSSEFKLKQYRVFTLWGVISEHDKNRNAKAKDLKISQKFLAATASYLFFLVVISAFVRFGDRVRPLWSGVLKVVWVSSGQAGGAVVLTCIRGLLCALPLILIWLWGSSRRPGRS